MSKAPAPPDPYATAAAQTTQNKNSAQYNSDINRVDTYTPYGNSIYSQAGTNLDGNPHYQQNITLKPQVQQQLDAQQSQNLQLSKLGYTEANRAAQTVGQPLPDTATSGQAAQNAYYQKEAGYLDPQFAQQSSDMNSKLVNQGVTQGSDAWNRAQDDLGRQKTFAYGQAQDQAIGQGQNYQQQMLANALTARNQPFNELASIRSGTAIQNPQFQPTYTGGNAAPADISGNIYKNYQQQSANSNNFNNGLFSLAGTAASFA